MLRRLFRFHICKSATVKPAINSGSPNGFSNIFTDFKQYTTSIPITAGGSTLPRYSTAFGIFLPSGKRINGIARVARVVRATNTIIINIS